jgi:hypothetical protein
MAARLTRLRNLGCCSLARNSSWGKQRHLQELLVVALVVHQLTQQLEQRRFQGLRSSMISTRVFCLSRACVIRKFLKMLRRSR